MTVIKELAWFFKKEKKAYTLGVLSLLGIAVIGLIPPKLMGDIVDHIKSNTLTRENLLWNLFLIVLLAFIGYLLRYAWRVNIFGASFRLEKTLRQDLFDHFTKMSPTFFHDHRTGDLMAHATNDLKAIQRLAGGGVLQFADSILTGVTTLIAMGSFISWKLTIVALLPMPFMFLGVKFLTKRIHKRFEVSQAAFSDLNDKTHESVNGIKVTKAFGQEKEEIASFNHIVS